MPKYTRNTGKPWIPSDVKQLRELAKDNTPTRVIGLKPGERKPRFDPKPIAKAYP